MPYVPCSPATHNRRMPTTTYRDVLRLPGVAALYGVSFVARMPAAMVGVVLTLHVVTTLGRGYAQAGVVAAAATVGIALGGPWRGRRVDRQGLRRALAPSVVVESAVWLAAPHLGYEALVVAAFVAGLFVVPVFPVTRQALAVLVPRERQHSAFALDSVGTELTFMLSPVLGVLLATRSSTLALSVVGVATVGGGLLLMWTNPPTRSAPDLAEDDHAAPGPVRVLSSSLVVLLITNLAATFVLIGTDVSLVATLTESGRSSDVGWMIALWAGGSAIGGLVHGARRRGASPLALVAVLAGATLPLALAAPVPWALALAVVVAGVPCAPALAAINAALVALVPERRRGEVMGWSGTTATVGNALGAPVVGAVVDGAGPSAGFLCAAGAGLLVVGAGLLVRRAVRAEARPGPGTDQAPARTTDPRPAGAPAAVATPPPLEEAPLPVADAADDDPVLVAT